ncbi:MAG: DUF4367 domain-containing protein [Desulfitobacteriaceae bacterium]
MSLNDEQLDMLIRQRIRTELQQIPVPPVDEEWNKFRDFVIKENNRSRRIALKVVVASVALIVMISGSLTLFKPVQAYAFGESIMQIFNHWVGKTTKDKTETINNSSSPPLVQNLGSNIEKQLTLDEAQKIVSFQIAKPKYLPVGTTSPKIFLTNIGTDVYKMRMEYIFRGKTLIFTQQNTAGTVTQGRLYDTDDTIAKNILINGARSTFSTDKGGVNVLTWHLRGLLLQLTGELPKDEFLEIAKSIN